MNPLTWLMRASRWSRNPPSAKRVKLLLALLGVVIVIVVLDKTGYWPEWATLQGGAHRIRMP